MTTEEFTMTTLTADSGYMLFNGSEYVYSIATRDPSEWTEVLEPTAEQLADFNAAKIAAQEATEEQREAEHQEAVNALTSSTDTTSNDNTSDYEE